MDRRARIEGGIVSEPNDYENRGGDMNILGSGNYQTSQTKT